MNSRSAKLLGQKFGKLTIIEKHSTGPRGAIKWRCRCDCGQIMTANTSDLTRKDGRSTYSCGCSRRGQRRPAVEVALNDLYHVHKINAKYRKLQFSLDKDEHDYLTQKSCHYCNRPPSNTYKIRNYENATFKYTGIDRVKNNLGYISSNVVPCCKVCNIMKHTLGYVEFLKHIHRIFKNKNLENMLGSVTAYGENNE
jgi:hypothetical protein